MQKSNRRGRELNPKLLLNSQSTQVMLCEEQRAYGRGGFSKFDRSRFPCPPQVILDSNCKGFPLLRGFKIALTGFDSTEVERENNRQINMTQKPKYSLDKFEVLMINW